MPSLIELRARNNGMKQRELAAFLGVSQATISNWERNGMGSLTGERLSQISNLFNITIDELLIKEDFKSPKNNQRG